MHGIRKRLTNIFRDSKGLPSHCAFALQPWAEAMGAGPATADPRKKHTQQQVM